MTLREEAAKTVLGALIGDRQYTSSADDGVPEELSALAVRYADALVAKLGEGEAHKPMCCGTCAQGSTVNELWCHCSVFGNAVHFTMSCPDWEARR